MTTRMLYAFVLVMLALFSTTSYHKRQAVWLVNPLMVQCHPIESAARQSAAKLAETLEDKATLELHLKVANNYAQSGKSHGSWA